MTHLGKRPDLLSEGEWQQALELWNTGHDTFDIAHCMNVHESVIYNSLPWRRRFLQIPKSEAAA